jgi:hypothetical protein
MRELVENVERPRQQRGRDPEGVARHQRCGREPDPLNFRLLDPLGLGAPVLEPYLDLGLSELELVGELGPLRDGEVLLLPELLLQGVELLGGEGGARLPVGFVLSQRALEGPGGCVEAEAWKEEGKLNFETESFQNGPEWRCKHMYKMECGKSI